MASYTLNTPTTIRGRWYLPEDPDRKVSGELEFSPNKIELNLLSSLKPLPEKYNLSGLPKYDIIHGVSIKGEALTAFRCQGFGPSFGSGSGGFATHERINVSYLAIGAWLSHDDLCNVGIFRIPGLIHWMRQTPIEIKLKAEKENNSITTAYTVHPPFSITTKIQDIGTEIEWWFRHQSKNPDLTEISVKAFASIAIKPESPKPIEWFFDQCAIIESMVTCFAGVPFSKDTASLKIYSPEGDVEVKVLANFHHHKLCTPEEALRSLLFLPDLGISLEQAVSSWMQLYQNAKKPINLAQSVARRKGLELQLEFLLLMQAIEGFHKAWFSGGYLDSKKFEDVYETVVTSIPAFVGRGHRQSIESRLKYANQKSLRTQLNELADLLADNLKDKIFSSNPRSEIQKWVSTRNYFTHWDERDKKSALDGSELYHAAIRLQAFINVLLLVKVGIDQTKIIKALDGINEQAQDLLRINSTNDD